MKSDILLACKITLDIAAVHRVGETVAPLERETPIFLHHPNSQDLSPVGYKIWIFLQERVYRLRVKDANELKLRLVNVWGNWIPVWWILLANSGDHDSLPVFGLEVDTLSSSCKLFLIRKCTFLTL